MISKRIWELISKETKKTIRHLVAKDISKLVQEDLGYSLIENVTSSSPTQVTISPPPTKKETKRRSGIDPATLTVFGRTFPSFKALCEFFEVNYTTAYSWLAKGEDLEPHLRKNSPKIAQATAADQALQTRIKRKDEKGNSYHVAN